MTDSFPEKLGKYKIIAEVGQGDFAAVYKAVDTTLDRTVALKVLAPHLLWDYTFVQRFQREARVAANLDHPSIVTIYEVSQIEGVYLIAMQFLEGRTLSQILQVEGPWPVAQVQAIIEQIASALDYAHTRGFVHRDIKPSNVIVADDGRATLTDFGLVKAGEGTKLSTTGVVFGTPEYMSPEQAEGEELDARSDIYSLAVCRRNKYGCRQSYQTGKGIDNQAGCPGFHPVLMPKKRAQQGHFARSGAAFSGCRHAEATPPLAGCQQHMQTLQIEGQAHQTPLACGRRQPPQRKLAEAQDFFDDANDRFHSALAQAVDGFANLGLELVSHLDRETGIFRRGCGQFGKIGFPTSVMRFASSGDVGVKAPCFTGSDVICAKVTIVHRRRIGRAQLSRNRV